MTIVNPMERLGASAGHPATGPILALTGALTLTVSFAALSQPLLMQQALVPATVTFMFLLAAGLALVAWLRPIARRHFTYLDAAGLLTFIGICVAATVEPEQMVQLVAGNERPR